MILTINGDPDRRGVPDYHGGLDRRGGPDRDDPDPHAEAIRRDRDRGLAR